MLAAILHEIALQADFLKGAPLSSIYLGGGTPSLLDTAELTALFETIHRFHEVTPDAEITLEANPDDLTREKLHELKVYSPVNRLSIGIQSFADADLQWMNRAHQATEARSCLEDALSIGFHNLTIDLIYGAPPTTDAQWEENLRIAYGYQIPHLSCYCLTVEPGTALGTFVRKGQQPPVEEEKAARQFEYLVETSARQGFDHYEISNFARPGHYARHNSNYWHGIPYLGIGPSAHAYDGVKRQWNVSNNAAYIKALQAHQVPFEFEVLTDAQRYNEYVMTALRTIWGVQEERISAFGAAFETHFLQQVQPFLESGAIYRQDGSYTLSKTGKLLADRLSMELFVSQ
jgi:oxygen-independent coproporphyrinogen III oxidase